MSDERSRSQAEQFSWGATKRGTDGGQGAEPNGLGVAVLEDGQIGHGHSDVGGQLDQGHLIALEKLVEVDRDAMVLRLGHQITVSSSVRIATPRSRIRAKAAKISPTATIPAACGEAGRSGVRSASSRTALPGRSG